MKRLLPEIETARLRLRQFAPDDAFALARLMGDPAVMRFIGTGATRGEAEAQRYVEKHRKGWREHGFGMWAVEFKEDAGALVGWCGLQHLEGGAEVEVGYGFGQACWGRGVASEGARASLRYGFEQAGLERIVAVAYPENIGSRRVMEKIGMKYVRDGFFYGADLVYYSITRAEFQPDDSPYAAGT